MTKRSSKGKKGERDHFQKPVPIPPSICAGCKRNLDLAFSYDDQEPCPGVLTICDECGTIMILNDDLTARAASADEIEAAKENKEIYDLIIYFSTIFKMRWQAPNN